MVGCQGDAGYQDAVDSADAVAKVWPDLWMPIQETTSAFFLIINN
jgi:hypothetical protein